ncbi:MAG: helix-turn-helix domain-containing protein [Burkholderiaceae bacterium]|nr:helix-turn-helix domain-containing protein [Burkholderiaceae bacterium]
MDAAANDSVIERIAPSGLMKPSAAAEYLQITESTLSVWRSTNRKKLAYVKVGGQVRYRRADLDAFINANLRNAPSA